ncbi:MAG: glycosyl hydrolase family 65 protein [Candidatus Wallbacteria bacterium]|nr:glycosyl hydrolase family 65 protein [Candidatus Wallbacteria bacterium]
MEKILKNRKTLCLAPVSDESWLISQESHDRESLAALETIFTLANGHMGLRSTSTPFAAPYAGGTFIEGSFIRDAGNIAYLPTAPDVWQLSIITKPENCVSHSVSDQEIISLHQTLDMYQGLLFTDARVRDSQGLVTRIELCRFVSLKNLELAVQEIKVTAENWSGKVEISAGLDATASCSYWQRRNNDQAPHKEMLKSSALGKGGIYQELFGRKFQGHNSEKYPWVIGIGAKLVTGGAAVKSRQSGYLISETATVKIEKGSAVKFLKYINIAAVKSSDCRSLKNHCENGINSSLKAGLAKILSSHLKCWKKYWDCSDVQIKGDQLSQQALRFSIFHLLQLAPQSEDCWSIAAKGLHGEGYAGHVFWDTEIYLMPFYTWCMPRNARRLIDYRYRTLDGARGNARAQGYIGAKFAWESAGDGSEEIPPGFPFGEQEIHICADVALGVQNYVETSGDRRFFERHGLEIMLETARFYESRVQPVKGKSGAWEIIRVTGPDEWHPDVKNNFFTNSLAAWNLRRAAVELKACLKKNPQNYLRLQKKLGLDGSEPERWMVIADGLALPQKKIGETVLYEQFEGYFKLRSVGKLEKDECGMPVAPPEQEVAGMQLAKQADVTVFLTLFHDNYDQRTHEINHRYYEPRTLHVSSLSPSFASLSALRAGDIDNAYEYFALSATLDLQNRQKNTKAGIHTACLGGTWQSAVNGFGGISQTGGRLSVNPELPKQWKQLKFRICFQGRLLEVESSSQETKVTLISGKPLTITIHDREMRVDSSRRVKRSRIAVQSEEDRHGKLEF